MNIELINIKDANINDIFMNLEDLIKTVVKSINENLNSFCTPSKNITEKNTNFTYKTLKINEYPNDYIGAQIYGIYQKGIVIKIFAGSNPGIYKYDTITSGLLIINKNKQPIFVIEEIDGRKEQNRTITKVKEPTIFIKTNQNKIELEINDLGKRIDQKYVGSFKNNIYYNEMIHQQKMNMLKSKFKLLILKYLEKIEQVKEETIKLPKTLKKKI